MARQPPPLLPTGTGRMDWRMKKGSPLPVQSPARRHLMTSEPIRDPLADHLLTPQNCALVIIDYQPVQVRSVKSMDQGLLVDRVVHPARFGMLYRLPIVLSTVNVSTGRNQPTIGPLQDVLPGITALDRTTINAWGRRRVQAGGPGGRAPQTDHGRAVDRGLPDLPLAGCDARGIPGLPGDRRRRRDITRGAPGRAGPHRPGRRQTDQRGSGGL